jgi:hypothetical protein
MSPRSSKQHAGIWQFVCFLSVLIAVAPLASCGGDDSSGSYSSSSDYSSGSAAAKEQPTELDDGSYSCEATNDTRGNGPYTLSCDKSGDTATIHFDNGGYVELDIDSQELDGEGSWVISGTDSRGDTWTLNIDE